MPFLVFWLRALYCSRVFSQILVKNNVADFARCITLTFAIVMYKNMITDDCIGKVCKQTKSINVG